MDNKEKKNRQGERLKKPKWDLNSLPQIVKKFYREHPAVSRRSEKEIEEFRKKREINTKGRSVLKPVFNIEEANFPPHILELLNSYNISDPTAIQCQSWPVALAGRDLVAVAETGSGKTLGYVLPGIIHTTYQPSLAPGEGPTVVILVPTRELAIQVCTAGIVLKHICYLYAIGTLRVRAVPVCISYELRVCVRRSA